MSLHSTSSPRSSVFRRGLVALATATTLLAGGLVVAPAAQAAQPPPVVDVHTSQGTTVTTSMYALGSTISGDVDAQLLGSAEFKYLVTLSATGGTLVDAEVEVTLQKTNRQTVRNRVPIVMRRTSTGLLSRGIVHLSGAMATGTYRAGVEVSVVVRTPDGDRVRHSVDVDTARLVQFRRDTYVSGAISTQATDGRSARINAVARVLHVADDESISWVKIRSGTALLSFDADGPYGPRKRVFLRHLKIGSDGRIATVVDSRQGFWKITYPGTSHAADSVGWIPQGEHSGCGC